MKDTGFSVPASELDRFATSYSTNFKTGEVEIFDKAKGGQWTRAHSLQAHDRDHDDRSFDARAEGCARSAGMAGWGLRGLRTREDMVTILMTQRAWTSPSPPDVCLDFRTLAYQAIED
jgi:hypothetical protein